MTPQTVTYYDYFKDVEPKLCEYMGIERESFRNLGGNASKDLWFVLLGIMGDKFKGNDSFCTLYQYAGGTLDQPTFDYLDEYYTEKALKESEPSRAVDEWKSQRNYSRPLYDALDKLHKEYGEEILIWFSW